MQVLINGRRAGTANLTKLSLDQIERIEIVRGPTSAAYGSQAMGGVIDIITKTGRSIDGGSAMARIAPWDGFKAAMEGGAKVNDNWSVYAGVSGETHGNWDGGKGADEQINTQGDHAGAPASISYVDEAHAVDFTVRTDGSYGAGFPGIVVGL